MLMEQDVAYSGTNGKTIAYIICTISKALELKSPGKSSPTAIIVLPSRELAVYVHELYCSILPGGLTYYLCIGGTAVRSQMKEAKEADIVIGTAGRILDMVNRATLKVSATSILVLDEVNTLLVKKDTLYDIFQKLPTSVQVIATSPFFPPATLSTFTHFLKTKPISDGLPLAHLSIKHYEVSLSETDKLDASIEIISRNNVKTIVYVNTRRKVDWLCEQLRNASISSLSCLHGDIDQNTRQLTLSEFKQKERWVLVTCGTMLHGLKFNGIRLVILFDEPSPEDAIRATGLLPQDGSKGSLLSMHLSETWKDHPNAVPAIPLPADVSGIF
uniref:RNA helicase n=1 Tax=Arcella intermedia TaxID=1963864 RepID=A0A6B2L806_9EUKA